MGGQTGVRGVGAVGGVRADRGGVRFLANLHEALRIAVWSRIAMRLLWPLLEAEVHGAEETANVILTRGAPGARFGRPAVVNGKAGLVVVREGRLVAVVEFTLAGDRIAELDLVVDPEKLQRVRI